MSDRAGSYTGSMSAKRGCTVRLVSVYTDNDHMSLTSKPLSIQEVALLHGIGLLSPDVHHNSTCDSYAPTDTDPALIDYASFARVSCWRMRETSALHIR